MDELDAHSPLVTNLQVLKRYREDLAVSKNLSGQDPSLVTQVSGQTLGGDNVPSYLLPIPEFYRCPLDLVLMQHPFLTPSTQLWQPDAVMAVAVDADATSEDVDFLVVVNFCGLTRDHVSVLVVGGTTMCLKMVNEVQEAQVGSGGCC